MELTDADISEEMPGDAPPLFERAPPLLEDASPQMATDPPWATGTDRAKFTRSAT